MRTERNTDSGPISKLSSQGRSLLAIDPGTKFVGYAHFKGADLIDFGVVSVQTSLPIRHLLQIHGDLIERLIGEKKPDLVVLEKNVFSNISQNLRLVLVIGRAKAVARSLKIEVQELAPRTIRSLIANDGNASKADIMKLIVSKYRQTKPYAAIGSQTSIAFHQNAFDAIAAGLASLKREDMKRTPPNL